MNRKIIALITSLVLLTSACICFACIKEKPEQSGVSDVFAPVEGVSDPMFNVRRNGEKIGVYENKTDKLYMSINTYVFTLPEIDRTMLENGFDVTKDEIIHVVEDYTG